MTFGSKREPQLVLLDHGLYKQLTDDFRLNYCRLWKVTAQMHAL